MSVVCRRLVDWQQWCRHPAGTEGQPSCCVDSVECFICRHRNLSSASFSLIPSWRQVIHPSFTLSTLRPPKGRDDNVATTNTPSFPTVYYITPGLDGFPSVAQVNHRKSFQLSRNPVRNFTRETPTCTHSFR